MRCKVHPGKGRRHGDGSGLEPEGVGSSKGRMRGRRLCAKETRREDVRGLSSVPKPGNRPADCGLGARSIGPARVVGRAARRARSPVAQSPRPAAASSPSVRFAGKTILKNEPLEAGRRSVSRRGLLGPEQGGLLARPCRRRYTFPTTSAGPAMRVDGATRGGRGGRLRGAPGWRPAS